MEIIFLLISIALSVSLTYLTVRIDSTHEEAIRIYKNSEDLVMYHIILNLVLILVFFILFTATNNTFWHLPYMFIE